MISLRCLHFSPAQFAVVAVLYLPLAASAGTSADYRTDFETTGSTAGASSSASYSQRAEAGAESLSTALSTDNFYSARQGFAGQLYNVESVMLPEMDPLAAESSTFTLHPLAFLDDGTVIDAPDRFAYSDLTPFTSTSAAGLCTAAAVKDRTFADIYISLEDVDNTGIVGIDDTDVDNFGAYGGDGVGDYWQIQYFGEPWSPQAAAGADADGDGMDNRSEFQQGYDPTNRASAMQISLTQLPGQTQVTWGPLLRNFGSGVKLMTSPDLTNWSTFQSPVPRAGLPGGFLRETDVSGSARSFYKLQWPVTMGGYNSFLQYGHNDAQRPVGRRYPALIWTGNTVLMWGGDAGAATFTGARYYPVTDTWTPTSLANAPLPRRNPAVVWTGSEMIVFGGQYFLNASASDFGGRYNPVTDTWTTMPAQGVMHRANLTGTWTGSEAIFCGGDDITFTRLDIYSPSANTWRSVNPPAISPGALQRSRHVAVWTGKELLIWGGSNPGVTTVRSDGWRFDPATNVWSSMSSSPLSARASAAYVWTGTELLIWGGAASGLNSAVSDGARYNPVTNLWTMMSSSGAPSARYGASFVWTGRSFVVSCGENGGIYTGTGAAYDPAANTWTALPSGPSARANAGAVWADAAMFLFGGIQAGNTFSSELRAWVGPQALVP